MEDDIRIVTTRRKRGAIPCFTARPAVHKPNTWAIRHNGYDVDVTRRGSRTRITVVRDEEVIDSYYLPCNMPVQELLKIVYHNLRRNER